MIGELMFRSIRFAAAFAAFSLVSIGAHAQQGSGNEAPRFDGLYLGVGGGYGDLSSGGDGGYGELFIGFRKQTDTGLVYGIEGVGSFLESTGDTDVFLDFDSSASILAKVGYTSDNRFMYYGGLGYTSIDVNDTLSGGDGSSGGVAFEAGVEYMATKYFGLRLRGQYHAVGSDADIASIGAALLVSF